MSDDGSYIWAYVVSKGHGNCGGWMYDAYKETLTCACGHYFPEPWILPNPVGFVSRKQDADAVQVIEEWLDDDTGDISAPYEEIRWAADALKWRLGL